MKKISILLISLSLFLTGCFMTSDFDNTPTKQVEAMLSKYQTLDKDVLQDLDNVSAEEEGFNTKQREKYKKIMKNHYKDLTYEIKDERIDGDDATVEVEIEVNNYAETLKKVEKYKKENEKKFYNNGVYDVALYMDYKLEQLEKTKDKVKYTLDLSLTKKDKKWHLDNLSDTDQKKINGIYED